MIYIKIKIIKKLNNNFIEIIFGLNIKLVLIKFNNIIKLNNFL